MKQADIDRVNRIKKLLARNALSIGEVEYLLRAIPWLLKLLEQPALGFGE